MSFRMQAKQLARPFGLPLLLLLAGSLALVAANLSFPQLNGSLPDSSQVAAGAGLRQPLRSAAFVGALIARAMMFAGYVLALVRMRRGVGSLSLRPILFWTLLVCLPFFFMPFLFQTDVYSYVIYGRIAAIYNGNPFVDVPALYPKDPYLPYVSRAWLYQPSVYGPAWVALSHVLTLLVEALGGGAWLYELAYRLTLIALHLGGTVLVWRILGQLQPRLQRYGALFFAWNPLLLIEAGAYIHNDGLMLFLLLLTLQLHLSRRHTLAMLAFALSILTKWIPALLAPLYLVLLLRELPDWRRRLLMVGRGLAVGTAAAVLAYAPYWSGPETLSVFAATPSLSRGMNSLGDLIVKEVLARGPPVVQNYQVRGRGRGQVPRRAIEGEAADDFVLLLETERTMQIEERTRSERLYQAAIRIGLALVGAAGLWCAWRVRAVETLVQGWAWLLFVYLCCGAIWFLPWYVTWFVGVAALLPRQRLELLALVFAASALIGDILPDGSSLVYYRALVIFIPPLLCVVSILAKTYLLKRQEGVHG